MLVDHADAKRLGVARVADGDFLAVDPQLSAIGDVEAHDALDEGRLARAVLTEKGVKRAHRDRHRHVLECAQGAEALAHAERFEGGRASRARGGGHGEGAPSSVRSTMMATGPP